MSLSVALKTLNEPDFITVATGLTSPKVTLVDLVPGTVYVYQVTDEQTGAVTDVGTFRTPSDSGTTTPPTPVPPTPVPPTPTPTPTPPGTPPPAPPPGVPPSVPPSGPPGPISPPPVIIPPPPPSHPAPPPNPNPPTPVPPTPLPPITPPSIPTPPPSTTPPPSPSPPIAKRDWSRSPGQNGSFFVQPFYNSAAWITSGSLVTSLRNGTFSQPTGAINLQGNFSAPFYRGTASDPLVTVTDGTKTIHVRIPLGATVELPTSGVDQSIGGTDTTQPYLVWSGSNAVINTGTVKASGSIITCGYGLVVQDGAGLILVDRVTGSPGTNNSIGGIQDLELYSARADPNYVIDHMLCFQMDPTQAAPGTAGTLAWPLNAGDGGATYTGNIPQGITIGIPWSTPRPLGKSRGFYLLWDNLQQYGWANYNFGGAGCTFITSFATDPANYALQNDMVSQISSIMASVCILNYQQGVAGAQYSLATTKGYVSGATSVVQALPLDLSPTNGVNIPPGNFGAWYPNTSYTAVPTNTPPTSPPTVPPPPPTPVPPTPPTPVPPTPPPTSGPPINPPVVPAGWTFFEDFLGTSVNYNIWHPTLTYMTPDTGSTSPGTNWFCVDPTYAPTASLGNPFTVANSILTINANPTPKGLLNLTHNAPYTTGQLNTRDTFYQKFGYFECKAKINGGQGSGTLSVLWMVPQSGVWPPEIDNFQVVAQSPNALVSCIVDGTADNPQFHQQYYYGPPADLGAAFHVYGVDWQADYCTFYLDNVQVAKIPTGPQITVPMHLILSFEIHSAADWGGAPLPSQTWPQQFQVDYIAAWNTKPAVATPPITPPAPPPGIIPSPPPPAITPPSPPPAPVGTGAFVVRNGLIQDPDGKNFIARGINLYDQYTTASPTPPTPSPPTPTPVPSPLRIMPMGDSITEGTVAGGYRAPLYTQLTNTEHYNVLYVGSSNVNPGGGLPSNEVNHDGFGGWVCPQLIDLVTNQGIIQTYAPDLVLLLIGTNDLFGTPQTNVAGLATNISTLLDRMIAAKSNIRIMLSTLLQRPDDTAGLVNAINARMPGIAASRSANVTVVDLASLLTFSDLADGLHPTQAGYNKMAAGWEAAIKTYYNSLKTAGTNQPYVPIATALLNAFPGINFIRLNCFSYSGIDSASSLNAFITQMTALKIVIEIEDHTGISAPPYTGTALTNETNWYASLAQAFKTNPYVWFGTFNEASNPTSGSLSAQHVAIYNAIRNTGNANPILMCLISGGNPGTIGTGNGLISSSYANMTNIVWDLHQYNWTTQYTTNLSTISTYLAVAIGQTQQITSRDGLVPVIIGEYGISTDGASTDAGGTQLCQAVQASGKGSAAWGWLTGQNDNLTDGNGNLTSYGRQVAGWIASQTTTTSPPGTPPSPPTSGSIITPSSGGSVSDSSGNVFTLSQTGALEENGADVPGGGGTDGLASVNGVIWARDAASQGWYTYVNGQFLSQGSSQPIVNTPTPPPATPPPSTPSPPPTPPAPPTGGKPRIIAPLSGSVTTGTWTSKDITVAGVTLPSGKPVHFNYLLPAQYSTNSLYPIMLWLHPNHEADAWYSGQNGNAQYVAFADADGFYNTTSFRTKYPAITVVAYADQTGGLSDELNNFGGWANNGSVGTGTHFSGDSGPNTFASIGVIQWVIANLSADPSRVYINGFSLGGIGSEYYMLKYNQVNGLQKIFTAASSCAGVVEINGWGAGPNANDYAAMATVPCWWVSGGQDGESIPAHWNDPMWQHFAGNSNYPTPGGTAAQARAGTSNLHYWRDPNIGHQETNASGAPYPTNSTILDWMFAQVGSP